MDIYLYAGNYGVKMDAELLEALAFLQTLQFLDEGNPGLEGIFQIEAGIAENLVPEACAFGKKRCRKKDCLSCAQKRIAHTSKKWKYWTETVETSNGSLLVFASNLHMLDIEERLRKAEAMEAASILWKKKVPQMAPGKELKKMKTSGKMKPEERERQVK